MYDATVTNKQINGVDAAQIFETTEAVRAQPELARMQFRAANEWLTGTRNRTTINEVYGAGQEHAREKMFVLEKDEPLFLLGSDVAANPVEHLLAALAGCLTTTLVFFAAAENVQLNSVTSKFEADASLLGFLGLDENTRMGCDHIRVKFDIEADAPREKIEQLVDLAQSHSAVFDMLTNKTPVSIELI